MLRLRVTSDCQPRTKNGHPAQSTTGVVNTNWIQFDSVGSTQLWPPTRWPPISRKTGGTESTAPIQKRRVMSVSSAFGGASRLATEGYSAMPQIGQFPAPI